MDWPALLRLHVPFLVDRIAEQVEDATEGDLAHGHGDRSAGVKHLGAASQAVRGVHGDRADALVSQVLLDLAHERALLAVLAVGVHLDLERGVDLRQLLREEDLEHDALDLLDGPDVRAAVAVLPLLLLLCCSSVPASILVLPYRSPSAPATTSMISCVISAWRWRLASSVRSSINSAALSEALRIADMRAPCSDAVDSSSAL